MYKKTWTRISSYSYTYLHKLYMKNFHWWRLPNTIRHFNPLVFLFFFGQMVPPPPSPNVQKKKRILLIRKNNVGGKIQPTQTHIYMFNSKLYMVKWYSLLLTRLFITIRLTHGYFVLTYTPPSPPCGLYIVRFHPLDFTFSLDN